VDFEFSPEDEVFRDEVRTFLADKSLAMRMLRVIVPLIVMVMVPLQAAAAEIDFTRYLSNHLSDHIRQAGDQDPHHDAFFGVPGGARLIVTSLSSKPGDELEVSIQLNGIEVVGGNSVGATSGLELPITLVANNAISVTFDGPAESSLSIRVKQMADLDLHVQSRVHFNTNVSDFVAASEFYGKLGFETLSGFPDTNTQEMARAIGIETPTSYDGSKGETAGGYLLHGELVGFGFFGGLIDLIEFTIPRNEEPPYAQLNHLGMARAAMLTTNIAADYRYMRELGVEFISPPTSRSDGTTFAIFSDLDGTHYELIEILSEDADDETETTHIVSLAQVNVNVSDFERSRAWYQMLGFTVANKLAATDSMEVANAMGFADKFEIDGAIIENRADGSTLELVQWVTPYNPERAYSVPVNHLGIHRMAFSTTDIDADVAALKSQGVEFVSEVTPCCSGPDSSGGIVAFYDPDGTVVELVEQPFMGTLLAVLNWFRNLFD
jgi:catechol 2,3-dioxygenase-like lactoylglutathione lyase family enzyme